MTKKLLLSGLLGALLVLGLVTTALAAVSLTRVSETASGDDGNAASRRPAISADGRYVAFYSEASNLVPGDTNGFGDVFVKDLQTGAIERVNVSSDGQQANDDITFFNIGTTIDISADGRFVTFITAADNLVPNDTNGEEDVFIHDRQTGQTERALRDDGSQSIGQASTATISGDGRYVAFSGSRYDAAGTVLNRQVWVYDRQTDSLERISTVADFGNNFAGAATISDDGRWVAFTSSDEVILYDRDTDTWEVANPRFDASAPVTSHSHLTISVDGRFVGFQSPGTNLVDDADTPGTWDVFVYDRQTSSLERIPAGSTNPTLVPTPEISSDGRFVAFVEPGATYGGDSYSQPNGVQDVVVYDRQTATFEVVSVHPDGTAAEDGSGQPAISADGRFVAFSTSEPFDEDDEVETDIYRVDREGTAELPAGECIEDFTDVDDDNVFQSDICWLADQGITRGCNPPANTEFCPKDSVTRGQMAAFLHRALGGILVPGEITDFVDDNGSVFEADIEWLGATGVTRGCNPPTNNRFCPDQDVTRDQMAAFLRRALES